MLHNFLSKAKESSRISKEDNEINPQSMIISAPALVYEQIFSTVFCHELSQCIHPSIKAYNL